MELAKCKIDMMSLNSQLLDAIQQKLNLSQQLEAWQVGDAQHQYEALVGSTYRSLAQGEGVYWLRK